MTTPIERPKPENFLMSDGIIYDWVKYHYAIDNYATALEKENAKLKAKVETLRESFEKILATGRNANANGLIATNYGMAIAIAHQALSQTAETTQTPAQTEEK